MDLPSRAGRKGPLVIIPRRVADRFTAEIQANPRVEVGGKYLGFIRGQGRYRTLEERLNAVSSLIFQVTDYLDDGPKAERAAGFHMGDVDWQVREFRKLERQFPELEPLGSWHSHHPNGMSTLSTGDIHGYMATVNHPDHTHDFFFVSLGVDRSGFATARHYLFIRDDNAFYELTVDNVRVVAKDESIQQHGTMQGDTADQDSTAQEPDNTVRGPDKQAPDNKRVQTSETMQSSDRPEMQPSGAEASDGVGRQLRLPGWSDTSHGRKMLGREQDCLRDRAYTGIRLVVKDGRLIAKGSITADKGSATISLLYPSTPGRHDGLLEIAATAQPEIRVQVPGELSAGLEQAAVVVNEFLEFVRSIRRPDSLVGRVMKQFRG